eukprot:1647011-Pyramimonas_sp.AAC.1
METYRRHAASEVKGGGRRMEGQRKTEQFAITRVGKECALRRECGLALVRPTTCARCLAWLRIVEHKIHGGFRRQNRRRPS